jgi:hypothetical protein
MGKRSKDDSPRVKTMNTRRALISVAALFFILCSSLCGQDDSERVFQQIHEYLKGDIKSRTFSSPLLFMGQIVALGPVFYGVCKEAVNQTVDFAVTELLLGELSSDTFQYAYPNCTRHPLPSPPFSQLAQVILYCHHRHLCFQPVPATPERVEAIHAWIEEARRPEDDAAFAELRRAIRKSKPLQPGRGLIFEGEIASIQPAGIQACTISIPRNVEINVVKVLFGETPTGNVQASYGSVNCPSLLPLSVRLHARIIVYCVNRKYVPNQACLTPVEDSPQRLEQVSLWIAGGDLPLR